MQHTGRDQRRLKRTTGALTALSWLALACACDAERDPSTPVPASITSGPSSSSASAAAAERDNTPRPTSLPDPLNATRPFLVTQYSFTPLPLGWRDAPPARELQYMRSPSERGGVLPCEAPDPGFGVHESSWTHVRPMGQFIAPRQHPTDAQGEFDLVVHFHGQRPARKEVVRTGEDLVFMGVSLGIGKAYGPPFQDGALFAQLVSGVERKLSQRTGRPARVRRLALSGWSRGFEAIGEILQQPLGAKVDAVILLDSFHGSRDLAQRTKRLAPFVEFARAAARNEHLMFISYSSIPTKDYASTTETTRWLVAELGGEPTRARRIDPLGLELIEFFSRGSFHARGYAGNGKLDHCAQFGVYPDAIRAVAKRWRSAAH